MTGTGTLTQDLEAALKTIDEVLAHFQEVGDLAREARDRLSALQDLAAVPERPPAKDTTTPCVHLTQRQQEVLELLAQGSSNRRIGRTLNITEQTVKAHLHMIYRKLGAADRTEAVVIAMRRGVV
ncbi:response regulator transcription factor [Streptomyces caatingaensis]|uniref:HTH luxR-type domain-containing protein n=1 Tax=Streptomyces caatingaensis TaxID=1678637 RepID=A0A0K9XD36_9ACTN|nr:response regulator transcription factor [Streptomyces caatingaensis]KNB50557.1 hypothetical protein AC230_21685 [Streptomyces caatingaensis]